MNGVSLRQIAKMIFAVASSPLWFGMGHPSFNIWMGCYYNLRTVIDFFPDQDLSSSLVHLLFFGLVFFFSEHFFVVRKFPLRVPLQQKTTILVLFHNNVIKTRNPICLCIFSKSMNFIFRILFLFERLFTYPVIKSGIGIDRGL